MGPLPRSVRILLAGLYLWPALCAAAAPGGLRVYVSIEPLQYFVERVAGPRGDVAVLVEAGKRPETYEPTPRQVGALAGADVFFGVGLPLEAAWRRQLRETESSGPEWVDLGEGGSEPGAAGDHDDEGGGTVVASGHGGHDGIDPHIWLDPVEAQRMVVRIAGVLGRLDSANADAFEANAATLRDELQSLHGEIAGLLAESGVESFLVYHPAWGHFARTYGLQQISIESQGKEPGPRGLTEVIRKAKEAGIRTVFVDPRHSRRPAEAVAEAIDARVERLDPLAYDYIENLRRAAQAIADSRS